MTLRAPRDRGALRSSSLRSGDSPRSESSPPRTRPPGAQRPGTTFLFAAAVLIAGAGIFGASPSRALAEDWPQWHGPRRDLVSAETDWRTDWAERPPEVVWRAKVGTGFSSIAVADGLAYTLGHAEGRDTVYCFDAASGREVWRHSYPSKLVDNLHEGGPAATPTIAGAHVFTCGKEGHLFALDRQSGAVAWSADLRKLAGSEMPEWGFSGSPWVEGDRLYLDAGPLVAISRENGKLIWKTKSYRPGYGSPFLFDHGGKRCVSVLNNEGLLVARAEDGREVAFHPWETQYNTSSTTPIWHRNRVFISTGYNRGCTLLELAGDGFRVLWENRNLRNHMANSVRIGEQVFGFDGNSSSRRNVRLTCLDLATGEVRWKEGGLGCGSLIASGDRLLALGDDGELVVVAARPEGYREIARAKVLGGRCWTPPALAGGRIYCRNAAGDLVALDVSPKKPPPAGDEDS